MKTKLTRKQKAFADHLISNPKEPASAAAKATYGVTTENSARQLASENLTKPNVLAYLGEHDYMAQTTIVQAMNANRKRAEVVDRDAKGAPVYEYFDEPDHAIRLKASQDILDRIHGKAVQRAEIKATVVSIGIDLTSTANAIE